MKGEKEGGESGGFQLVPRNRERERERERERDGREKGAKTNWVPRFGKLRQETARQPVQAKEGLSCQLSPLY